MNIHQNARTTLWSRAEIVRRVRDLGQSVAAVAAAFHVSTKTVRRWRERATTGEALTDRSCRPHDSPTATAPELLEHIERLRRQRGPPSRSPPGCHWDAARSRACWRAAAWRG